jgi:hypothetical protein
MTAWGVAPARGRLKICGTCGATLAFVEARRPGESREADQRMLAEVEVHLRTSATCKQAETFSGGWVFACRCERPMRVRREDGLRCGRCEGLIAPIFAPRPSPAAG